MDVIINRVVLIKYLLIVTFFSVTVLNLEAKVFIRRDISLSGTKFYEKLGGICGYKSEVEINGIKADMEIFNLPLSSHSLLAEISNIIGLQFNPATPVNGFKLSISEGGNYIYLIAMEFNPQNVILFKFESKSPFLSQTFEWGEFERKNLKYSDGCLLFTAKNSKTGMNIACFETSSHFQVILDFYDRILREHGWKQILNIKSSNFTLYAKNGEICGIFANTTNDNLSRGIIFIRKGI